MREVKLQPLTRENFALFGEYYPQNHPMALPCAVRCTSSIPTESPLIPSTESAFLRLRFASLRNM